MIGFVKSAPNARRAFPVAKKTTVCQKGFTQKKDSVTIKKINSCRQKCRLKIRGRQWWNVEKQQDI